MSNDTQIAAPTALPDWEHPLVQAAYKILCSDDKPPAGEHWEGFVARRFVAAVEAALRGAAQADPVAWHVNFRGSSHLLTSLESVDLTDCIVTPLYP